MYAEALALSRNFLTLEDVALLKQIATSFPSRVARKAQPLVVDLGAGSGTSAIAMLENNPEVKVYTFDISEEALYWSEEAIKNYGLADRWEPMRHDAKSDPSRWYREKTLAAVLIDSSHLYEDTATELKFWQPYVMKGGWIWCHDYVGDGGVEENGVKRAFDEWAEGQKFVQRVDQGLGVAVQL